MIMPSLSRLQRIKYEDAVDPINVFPKITNDPLVNFAVDCMTSQQAGFELPEYDKALYLKEINAYFEVGAFVQEK